VLAKTTNKNSLGNRIKVGEIVLSSVVGSAHRPGRTETVPQRFFSIKLCTGRIRRTTSPVIIFP